MRPTPPKPPIPERDSETLLEDLCLALRDVGVHEHDHVTGGSRVTEAIDRLKATYTELQNRAVKITPRIKRLSEETTWHMEELLETSLNYPQVIPYVREKDGIRRKFRCNLCGKAECPVSDQRFGLCDNCLNQVGEAITSRVPIHRIVLYRTYNGDKWCSHANQDTVLANYDDEYWGCWNGWCEKCVEEEQRQRNYAKS